MKEGQFQTELIYELKKRFDGCIILKTDPGHIQGLPDLLVLYNDRWAALECKASQFAHKQPNQEYYISIMNDMSFARIVYPENMKEVLDELQRSFSV